MAGRSALEQLLPEVQQQILSRLESFNTLHALILASPRMYQVFRLNKLVTLSTVARRQFNSAATRDALAIEKLHQTENPPFSRDNVIRFFNFTSDELGYSPDSILPLPVSIRLGRLDETITFFIKDYAQNTLPILMQLKNSKSPSIETEYKQSCHAPNLDVSRCESERLRRAFCRFETYRQLFSQCPSDFNHNLRRCSLVPSLAVYDQAERFFRTTPAYQAAEIACVRDYLHRRLRGVFDQVENETVQKLQAESLDLKDKYQGLDWDWAEERHYEFLGDDQHYFAYSGKGNQSFHIEYLLSLGLPYIRRILESAGDERQDLLLRTDSGCYAQYQTEFITAALGLDPLRKTEEQYGRFDRNIDSCLDEDSKFDLPPGWLWAHTGDYYDGLVDVTAKGLRDWGYVFWDAERLQESGILGLKYASSAFVHRMHADLCTVRGM